MAGGRWSLVSELVPVDPSATAQAVARVDLLLARYGVVGRECATAEEIPGGFGPLYKVLREMEEQGRVRRGYFVEGLSGAQFAHAGAVDRLRAVRLDAEERDQLITGDDVVVLAAMDPANPYGALVPWPQAGESEQAGPRRAPGAWVLLIRGRPILYVAPRVRKVTTFPRTIRDEEGALPAALDCLRRLPKGGASGLLVIERIDGRPASESPLIEHFRAADYSLDYRGLIDVRPPG